jgi:transcriptional regulator with XRE-family HTH domain
MRCKQQPTKYVEKAIARIYEYRRMNVKHPTTLFGRRLREARQRVGFAQDQLGVRIGLDEGTASARMSRYETGVHAPSFSVAVKVAHALRLPTAYLYCEDDDLAKLILAWELMSRAERKTLKTAAEEKLADAFSKNQKAHAGRGLKTCGISVSACAKSPTPSER